MRRRSFINLVMALLCFVLLLTACKKESSGSSKKNTISNTYETPVAAAEILLNSKSLEKAIANAPAVLNGFGEEELKQLIKIAKKSDMYGDLMADAGDYFEEGFVQSLKDGYGDNYKIRIKIAEKQKLEEDELKDYRRQLHRIGKQQDSLDNLDPDDYEEMGEQLGLSRSEAKEAVKILEGFCKKCQTAKVTAGYELTLVISITGKEADEPEEQEFTICVYQVDGQWTPDWISAATEVLPSLLYGIDYYS